MAKALLLNALHDALADYVLDLSPERLKVGVWSGKIVLNELQVNPDAVNQLRLPAHIIHGTIKTLEVDIPWTHLGSKPVKVLVEGVCVLIGPVDKHSWGDDEVRDRRLKIKRQVLQSAEAKAIQESEGKDKKVKKGFVENLVQRIVDNIEINVSDIHIRYEDTVLMPGQTVSVGMCLESFTVTTTDSDFVPQFVDRTKKGSRHEKVHKLARVDGFSIYWRVDDQTRFSLTPVEERSGALREFVKKQAETPEGNTGGGLARGNLIRPTSAVLKFIHSDDPDDKEGPMFEASFEVDHVQLDVRAEQYEQALSLKDAISALQNWQTFFPYRPKVSVSEDPRAWWKYAFVCVTRKTDAWSKMDKVLKSRKDYMGLYKKIVAADGKKSGSKRNMSVLNPEEQDSFDGLEEELPVQSIVTFRAMARKELERKREEERAAKAEKEGEDADNKSGGSSWWGMIWGGSSDTKEEDDMDLDELAADMEEETDKGELPPDHIQVRVTVLPQGALTLYGPHDHPLVEARLAAAATFEMREDSSMLISFSLARLDVLDRFTKRAVFPHMLRVRGNEQEDDNAETRKAREAVAQTVARGATPAIQGADEKEEEGEEGEETAGDAATGKPGKGNSLAAVNVSMSETALDVELCALPTDVAYNREAVDALLSVFTVRAAEADAAAKGVTDGIQNAQKTGKELVKLAISVSLDVAAPKVIVPMSSSQDEGFLLLDMGHAIVQGGTIEDGSMAFEAQVSDITARLPGRKALLMKASARDAIVEPFKIKADAKIGGGDSKTGGAVVVEILPGVVGVISPAKIRSLFRVLDYVTKADLNAEDGPGETPVGLAAPNTSPDSGGAGVQLLGSGGEVGHDSLAEKKKDEGGKGEDKPAKEAVVMFEVHSKLPKVSLLLVAKDEDASDPNLGLHMEAAGMSLELKTREDDMQMELHLETVTVQDRTRPDESPFRNVIYTTPDETSHGGLIHVIFWMSQGGVPRLPPASVVEDNETEYDMVADARFSTLQLAIDKDCIVQVSPFFKAITRQDMGDEEEHQRPKSSRYSRGSKSRGEDTKSVVSAGSRMMGAAKRAASNDAGPKAILARASLTSVVFELVQADPWETVMQAAVSGLDASFGAEGGKDGGMEAHVSLANIKLTDVRTEAKDNAYRMLLAPMAQPPKESPAGKAAAHEGHLPSHDIEDVAGDAGKQDVADNVQPAPLIAVNAKIDGAKALDAQVKLASFACNLMVEPIIKSLVVISDVNAAIMDMLSNGVDDAPEDNKEAGGAEGHAAGDRRSLRDRDSMALEAVEEEEEESSMDGASATEPPRPPDGPAEADPPAEEGVGGGLGGPEIGEEISPLTAISARCELDDWRINLIEDPTTSSSRVVVFRSSVIALFGRSISSGEGGKSVEDSLHISLGKTESLVDQPSKGADGERRISQILEPVSAEVHANILSARGSLVSASLHLAAENIDARVSYRDVMLVKGLVDQVLSSELVAGDEESTDSDMSDDDEGQGGGLSLMPETKDDAGGPLAETDLPADKAKARAGVQPATVTAISLSAACSLARVVLINDYEGQGVPVLSMASRQVKASGSGFLQDFMLEASGIMEVSTFNVRVVRWEPMCEPWRPVLKAGVKQDFKGRQTLHIALSCTEVMILDVTFDFLESFLSTYWMLFSGGGANDPALDFPDPADNGSKEKNTDADTVVDDDTELGSTVASEKSTGSSAEATPGELQWAEGAVPLDGLKEGNVVLKNRSGLSLLISTTDYPKNPLALGPLDTIPLPFETKRHRARAGEFDLRGKMVFVGWDDADLESARETLPPLQIDRTGVSVFQLLPADPPPSSHMVSAPVIVEAYQNQRQHMISRQWSAPFMMGDGPEFISKDMHTGKLADDRETPLESITLPDDEKWEWRDEWHVDFSREVGKEIDAAGWEYAVDFTGFNLRKSRNHRDLDQARRRKWIRTRAPKALPLEDPFRPLYVVWDVNATPQGRLQATIRSKVQIKNSTCMVLDMRALCSAWPKGDDDDESFKENPADASSATGLGPRSLGSVAPGSTLDVPVKLVYASHVQMRPSASGLAMISGGVIGGGSAGPAGGGLFEWSAPLPVPVNSLDTSRDEWVSCREMKTGVLAGEGGGGQEGGKDAEPDLTTVRLVIHAETTPDGCVVMEVLPPVTLVNSLPCPLSFRAVRKEKQKQQQGSTKGSEGHEETTLSVQDSGQVATADTADMHTPEVGDKSGISVKIAHYRWSAGYRLLPDSAEELREGRWAKREVLLKVPCGNEDGFLGLRCQYEPRVSPSCPALQLTVYCSHWLVDRSGLRLGFGVGEKARLPVPVIRTHEDDDDDSPPPRKHLAPVEDLSCVNRRGAVVAVASPGCPLYTDREYTFKKDSLPPELRGARMIRTACADKRERTQHYLRFRCSEASTVHVLFDRRCSSPPEWLTSGFDLSPLRANVSHKMKRGKVNECPFVVWSKNVTAGSWVNLGGNGAPKAETMYVVIVAEEKLALPVTDAPSSLVKRTISSREDLEESWAIGTEGMALCDCPGENVRVAVPEGAARNGYGDDGFGNYTPDSWSDQLDVPSGTHGVFDVKGTRGELYELALRAEQCAGLFRRTTQVTVVPRYCLVNLLADEKIFLKAPGAPDSSAVSVDPGGRIPWHWLQGRSKHSGVRVRTENTAWSYGDIILNQVGTTALHIPFFGENEDLDSQHRGQAGGPPMKLPEKGDGGSGVPDGKAGDGEGGQGDWSGGRKRLDQLHGEQTVVHVDVKLADDNFKDEYAVLVVFWKSDGRKFPPTYLARNASPLGVSLHQAGSDGQARRTLKAKASWRLKPRVRRQIGWAYPSEKHRLEITAGTGERAVELNADTVGNYARIPTGVAKDKGPSYVWASVLVEGGTKVIHVSARPPRGSGGRGGGSSSGQEQYNLDKESASKRKQESEAAALEVSVDMRGFGLSLIGMMAGRRQEVVYAQVSDVRAKLSRDRLSSIQASVGSFQVDNHMPDGLYPVLASAKREERKPDERSNGKDGKRGKGDTTPFLQLSVIKEVNEATNTAHFDYVAFRMLEVDVMADRSSLLRMLVLSQPVQDYLMMWRQELDSRAWVAKRTAEVIERGAMDVPGGFVDVAEVRRTARIQRKYIKTMRFHPIILRLSYARSTVSDELVEAAGMPIINKIPSVMRSHIALSSYLVEDAFGSLADIGKNVVSHYTLAATTQVFQLVGSIRALGSPADLISNVGGGAKSLVYEPAQGLVQGPAEFFDGVRTGAQSFVKGTVHGVFSSVAGVGGAVTDTAARLTFDSEYRTKRQKEKNKAMVQQGGVGQSIVKGGKEFAGGISSGVTGIFTNPVRETKKGGVGGFFKGVGQGVIGAVVKPVVGVADAAVSVVEGVSNQTADAQTQTHIRPKRALTKDTETGQLILEKFSMEAAEAQELIENGVDSKRGECHEKYETHTQVGDLTIIFADTRVVLVKRKKDQPLHEAQLSKQPGKAKPSQMVSNKWEEVSSVDLEGDNIVIRRYEGGDTTLKASQASTREELYRQFYQHRRRMGDPTAMQPPEALFSSDGERKKKPVMTMKAHSSAVQESLKDYKFGHANARRVPKHHMNDKQILDRAEKQLQSIGVGNWENLDAVAWELVQNWDNAHKILSATRCLCVVFINASTSTVQFTEIRKRDGQGYRLLMGNQYDRETQQLMPGGVAILFAWGHPASNVLKQGYVVMVAETSAFSAVYAVQREKIRMNSKGGFQAGFLEKTMQEWYSKQVVVIK